MAADPDWLTTAYIVGGAAGAMVTGIVSGRKTAKKEPEGGQHQVLAASIVPRTEMLALTAATQELVGPIKRLVALLEAQAHARELEAEVKQYIRDRGLE